MLHSAESLLLAPDLTLKVRWSPRVADFVQDWELRVRLAQEAPIKDLAYTAMTADSVLWSVEHGACDVTRVLTDLYEVSGSLPSPGDILFVGSLELRVDERHIAVRYSGPCRHVTFSYAFGIERYRYEASDHSDGAQPLSPSFFV